MQIQKTIKKLQHLRLILTPHVLQLKQCIGLIPREKTIDWLSFLWCLYTISDKYLLTIQSILVYHLKVIVLTVSVEERVKLNT